MSTRVVDIERRLAPAGFYANVEMVGRRYTVSQLDGEEGWTIDAMYREDGIPAFVNGYGVRGLGSESRFPAGSPVSVALSAARIDLCREPSERPTAETDPGECRWCFEEAVGGKACPYHGEAAQLAGGD